MVSETRMVGVGLVTWAASMMKRENLVFLLYGNVKYSRLNLIKKPAHA